MLAVGDRVTVRITGLDGFGERSGMIVRRVRRGAFAYSVRLDRPYQWRAGAGRVESWAEVHARPDEITSSRTED